MLAPYSQVTFKGPAVFPLLTTKERLFFTGYENTGNRFSFANDVPWPSFSSLS